MGQNCKVITSFQSWFLLKELRCERECLFVFWPLRDVSQHPDMGSCERVYPRMLTSNTIFIGSLPYLSWPRFLFVRFFRHSVFPAFCNFAIWCPPSLPAPRLALSADASPPKLSTVAWHRTGGRIVGGLRGTNFS